MDTHVDMGILPDIDMDADIRAAIGYRHRYRCRFT